MEPGSVLSGKSCLLLVLFFVVIFNVVGAQQNTKVFDVVKFGAVRDGRTDNSKAFSKAFSSPCQFNGNSRLYVPKGTFLVGSPLFKGPCKGPIHFRLEGTIRAPAGPVNKDSWINFQHIDRLTINGGGTFDGQGQTAWPYNDCSKNPNCQKLPISIRFDFITNSAIHGITSLNSKNFHMQVFGCKNLVISGVHITAPAESPNTDGIHMGHSEDIKILDSVIATGDDCVSLGPGCKNVQVVRVRCGPGHGISIGSLGKYPNELDVSGILFRNCTLYRTDNGLRIKTWATELKSKVYNITYEDVIMHMVRNPILIEQQYCPSRNCDDSKSSSVQIQDVWFRRIWGTTNTKSAVRLMCSHRYPCNNINLSDIILSNRGPDGPANATCSNVRVSASGVLNPRLAACGT